MTIPMTALRDFPYAGKRLKKGQDFNARGQSDARLLKAIGHAREAAPAQVQPPVASGTYNTRMLTAAPARQVQTQPDPVDPPSVIKVDGEDVVLDGMDAEELHALAAKLDVKVHYRSGADKVRAALVASQEAAE